MRRLSATLLLQMAFIIPALCQGLTVSISGPTTINPGSSYTYTVEWKYNGAPASAPTGGTHNWTVYGGTTYYSNADYITIGWTSGGTILYEHQSPSGYYYANLNVSTNNCAPQPSVTFSLASSTCSPRQLSYSGTPPSGITWYWQTSPTGTSVSNSTNTFAVTSPGTYYVRAYNASNSCWGIDAASYDVPTVTQPPGTPSTPTADSNTCGSKALFHGSPPSGITWYWQGTNPNGTSTSNSGTHLASASGTYYLRARKNTTGCWSVGSSSITVTVNQIPAEPATPTKTSHACGPQTLTKSGSPPSGVSWYWQGTNPNGTSTSSAAAASTYSANATGTYYLRARSSAGCWSPAASVSVTVNQIPATPSTPSISSNVCGAKTLTAGSEPTGVTWYWQGTNANGTSTSNSSSTYQASQDGAYYIRARANSGGCWSTASASVQVFVNPIPAAPSTPQAASNCAPTTISKVGSPSGGASWYWQGTNPNGTDKTSSTATAATYLANASGTYYLRAFISNSEGGCWSEPASVSVSNNAPPTPDAPTADSNTCGSKALFQGTAPVGVTWYWQGTNPNGTSTENSGTSLASESGTYYLRARNNTTLCWSVNSSLIAVTVNHPPDEPTTPTTTFHVCGPQTLTQSGTPPTDASWYWQGTNPEGTNTSGPAAAPSYEAGESGTYYLRAKHTNGCWSAAVGVSVSVNPRPDTPQTPSQSSNTCGPKTLTFVGFPQSGVTWYWQGTNANGNSIENPGSSISVDGDGTYYLRARDNSSECWSTNSSSVPVTLENPPAPPTPAPTNHACGPQTLTKVGSPPLGISWYWQGTEQFGTDSSPEAESETYTAEESGTYYLRARRDGDACWSLSSTPVAVSVYLPTPASPEGVIITEATESSFMVSWGSVSGIDGYQIDVAANNEFYPVLLTSQTISTSKLLSGLDAGASYYVRVRAFKDCAFSNDPAVIPLVMIPSAPVALDATNVAASSFYINWEPSNGATGYVFDLSTSPDFSTYLYHDVNTLGGEGFAGNPFGSIIVQAGVFPTGDTHHYYRIRAINSGGESVSSDVIEVKPLPAVPVLVVSNITKTSFALSWNDVSWASSYDIEIAVNEDFDPVLRQFMSPANSITITDLSPGGVYYCRARSHNSSGASSYSAREEVVTHKDYNYIKSVEILKEGIMTDTDIANATLGEKSVLYVYYDGIGRPIQSVSQQASPMAKDVVQPVAYDQFGREVFKYLPYAAPTTNASYQPAAIEDQLQYYSNGPSDKVADDMKPFSKVVFEQSPLNRIIEEFGPGEDWHVNSKSVKYFYSSNVDGTDPGQERVIVWRIDEFALPVRDVASNDVIDGGYYRTGQLFVRSVEDENGHETREYTDKDRRVIMKKVQYAEDPMLNDPDDWAQTYYIYDDFGFLRYVLQPELSKTLAGSSTDNPTETALNHFAFQYKYDGRGRMVSKRVPGSGWVYLVYDDRDRVVLTQDGNQREINQWLFTKYDHLNRPIMTGIYTHEDSVGQAVMNDLVSSAFAETYNGNPEFHGYTNTVFPTDSLDVLTVTYYDNYAFVEDLAGSSYEFSDGHLTGQEQIHNSRIQGQLTGTKTKVLGDTSAYLWTATYYDREYRPIQVISTNTRGNGVDSTTSVYDFAGRVTKSKITTEGYDIERRFEYDHGGRLLEAWHQLNSGPEVLLVENEYNELGQLVVKKLHSQDGSEFQQHVDHRYNIRGWLTRINKADLTPDDPNETRDFFGMEFGYNNDLGIGTFTPQYNGNISATKWSANLGLGLPYLNEPTERAYKFTYDPMNRLRAANYATKSGSWADRSSFGEMMDYDLNGNITSLLRNNAKGAPLDSLIYAYSGNRLMSVTDRGIQSKGFRDRNTTGNDYGYDANGNLTSDKNKNITNIKYNNYLNQTEEIIKENGEKVKTIYDAEGMKLAEEIYPAGAQTPVKRIDYVGPLVYENDTLKFIVHEEGKVVIPKDQSGPEYQYQIKDHLGNIRLTFTTKEKTEVFKATMEDTGIADYNNPRVQEMQHFGNLFETEIRNVNQWLNHTSNAIGNAIYLDGSENKTVGPYTMLKVYPGDTVKMEVFAKFENKSSHSTMPLVDLLVALANPVQTAAIGFEGGGAWSSSSFFEGLLPFLGNRSSSSTVPAAYINYILFDKDFKVVDLGFDRIDGSAGFNPAQENTVAFDKLELQRIIDRVGYIYVYVSNESEATRVWMDDIKVTLGQSPIVQFEDYYPFGLSQSETAFQRGNDKYTGMVTTDGTGLKDLGFRQYDAALGRFHAVDPLAELQVDQSTYQYAGNNPVNQIDVLGLEADDHDKDKRKKRKEERMVNGKKVKVHNGFVNRQQRRSERASNQRERQQARAERREQRQQRRDEHAKNKAESGNGEAQASRSSGNANEPGSSDPDPLINMLVSGPPLNKGRDKSERHDDPTNVFNNQNNNNRQPRFENSVTPPSYDDDYQSGSPSVIESARLGEQITDTEQYREYLYRNHSNNEARALYARMLLSRNYSYQSARLKNNVAAVANTTTSDDVIDPAQEEIKCPTCPTGWEDLIEFKPPQSSYDLMDDRDLIYNLWYIHEIEDAAGSKINLDYFPVEITELPDGMTAEELFEHVRLNFNDFIDHDNSTFEAYSTTDQQKWETDDFLNVTMKFNVFIGGINVDDLSVLATDVTSTSWTFTTIHSPDDGAHPVSGHRQFGIKDNGDGTFTLYTRAADRLTNYVDVIFGGESGFQQAAALWESLLDNVVQYINANGGSATVGETFSQRFDVED